MEPSRCVWPSPEPHPTGDTHIPGMPSALAPIHVSLISCSCFSFCSYSCPCFFAPVLAPSLSPIFCSCSYFSHYMFLDLFRFLLLELSGPELQWHLKRSPKLLPIEASNFSLTLNALSLDTQVELQAPWTNSHYNWSARIQNENLVRLGLESKKSKHLGQGWK